MVIFLLLLLFFNVIGLNLGMDKFRIGFGVILFRDVVVFFFDFVEFWFIEKKFVFKLDE